MTAGHRPQIMLAGEATYLMKDFVVEQIHGVGWPPLKELLQQIISHGVPLYV